MEKFREGRTQAMGPELRRSGTVVGLRTANHGVEFPLDADARRWRVGAGEHCDIELADDPCVSHTHCVLERAPGGALMVRDRSSRNGTRIDGNRVESAELRVGAYLTIGRTTLVAYGAATRGAAAIELLRGQDPALRATVDMALKVAASDCNVLIVGETGTGKDLLARIVHEASRRAAAAFVPVNCGGIPRELAGSELFGHEKGAFTGALTERDGYFVEASGGTLFLDELGELPPELQPALLRVLEARCVRRIGSAAERPVDVRIIAATNRMHGLGTEASSLRTDLYHRVATVVLSLPPLRERMGDIVEVVETMLQELVPEFGAKRVTDAAWAALASYDWPGNVRELRHAVSRAVTLGGDTLGPLEFFPAAPYTIRPERMRSAADRERDAGGALPPYQALLRDAMERALAVHGSIRGAANHIGMARSTFGERAKEWGLTAARASSSRRR